MNPIPEYLLTLAGVRPSTRLVGIAIVHHGRARFGPSGARFVFAGSVAELAALAVLAPRTVRRALDELARAGALGPRFGEILTVPWERLAHVGHEADFEAAQRTHDDDPRRGSIPVFLANRSAVRDRLASHHHVPMQAEIADALKALGVDDWRQWARLYPVDAIAEGLDRVYALPLSRLHNAPGYLRCIVRSIAAAGPLPPRIVPGSFEDRVRKYG